MVNTILVVLAAQQAFTQKIPDSTAEFRMVPIPAGKVRIEDRTVEVKPFFMAATETTWDAFDAFLFSGEPSKPYDRTQYAPDAIARPSRTYILPDLGWGHQGYPVINVTFETAQMFCRWLSSVTKRKYRLPTEAEWELAARAGATGAWSLSETELAQREWYSANSERKTNPVGKKNANGLGLFDILGNVGEWAVDVSGKPVLCGGDFSMAASGLVPTARRRYSPAWQQSDPQIPKSRWWLSDGWFAGFRVVCDP